MCNELNEKIKLFESNNNINNKENKQNEEIKNI